MISLGTPLYGYKVKPAGEPEDITILRAGILDDINLLDQSKPQVEIYTKSRIAWVCPLEGAGQFTGMLSV